MRLERVMLVAGAVIATAVSGLVGTAQAAPAEYVRTAETLAVPLYPAGGRRSNPSLSSLIDAEAPRIAYLGSSRVRLSSLRGCRSSASEHVADSAACLLALAAIDEVEPSGKDVLKRTFAAMEGGQEAQDRLEGTLAGVILAEVTKAVLRADYRESLVGRRQAAWGLWEAAKAHAGPELAGRTGIGVYLERSGRGVEVTGLMAGKPAERAGLRAGDVIVAVDRRPVGRSATVGSVSARLTGRAGTTVLVEVERGGRRLAVPVSRGVKLPTLRVDYDSSWRGAFSEGRLRMANDSGQDLTDVTVFVRMRLADGSWIGHTHFVREWSRGELLDAVYKRESMYNPHEDLDGLASIVITVTSDQGWTQHEYQYAGAESERDVVRWMKGVEFVVGNLERDTYWVSSFDRPAGIALAFSGRASIPFEGVTVTVRDGGVTRTVRWDESRVWSSGSGSALEFRHESFEGLTPDKVTFVFDVPGRTKPYTVTWTR